MISAGARKERLFYFVARRQNSARMMRLLCCFLLLSLPLLSYQVEITGVKGSLKKELIASSVLIRNRDHPPSSFHALHYRANSDVKRLLEVLHSKGYYGAKVTLQMGEPIRLIVETGPLYPLVEFLLDDPQGSYPLEALQLSDLGLKLGEPAEAKGILDAEQLLLKRLHECGWPLAQIKERDAIVDQAAQTVSVSLQVDSGPLCTFGKMFMNGLKRTRPRFIIQCLPWRYGDQYDPCAVATLTELLRESGIFCSVRVTHAAQVEQEGQLPIIVSVQERKSRTLGLGISYNYEQGFGPEFFLQHRNITGMGDKLTIKGTTGNREQDLTLSYRRPHFLCCRQNLLLSAQGSNENKPAYDALSFKGSVLIDRVFRRFIYSYGVKFEQVQTRKSNNNGTFSLLSAPLNWTLSTVDDLLDPGCGFRLHLQIQPTINIVDNEQVPLDPPAKTSIKNRASLRGFSKQQLWVYGYHTLFRDKRLILAGWATWGTLFFSSDQRVPPPERFYAGSDAALRGYRYQRVGPIGPDGKPTGGRSIMIYGAEARLRINNDFGVALFYEVGNVFTSQWPRFDTEVLNSVGIGPRYYTAIGPLSLDIAFPLNRSQGRARHFEIYVNIGQPF
ncbi:MAG: BamA/TamA family outer membrane protein [Verrucomicrobia bacterium]|nr:BamA/TamA family outer membrane protein [Verrucomicrobiota bacterium]